MKICIHVVHEDVQNALIIHNFEEIIFHFYDIGMVKLWNDGKFSVFVFGVLHNFLQSVLFACFFIHNLSRKISTR